jgi:iron complex transport system substrate-binding protein
MSGPRIVSLIASATEIVAGLGFGESLVGRSHECDYPPELVAKIPALTAPRFATDGSSADIDRRVKDVIKDGLSVYRVDGAMLRALAPDVIVTQAQCEVCAVSLADVEAAVAGWVGQTVKIVSCEPNRLEDVWRDIAKVADALGAAARGSALVGRLKARIDTIARRAAELPDRPRLACIEWIDPLMAAGNWMPELVALAGGASVFGEAGTHAPWLSWEALAQADPDAVLVMPCGFDIARSLEELPALARRPQWAELKAVKVGRVFVADGNQYFNRPGPRLVESLEILAELLHPEAFRFGHAGRGWVRA